MIPRNMLARVELLSDIHIGTGIEPVRDIDWIAPGDGYIYVAHGDRLVEEQFLVRLMRNQVGQAVPPLGWLRMTLRDAS